MAAGSSTSHTGLAAGRLNGRAGAASGALEDGRGLPGWAERLPRRTRQRRPGITAAGVVLVLLSGTASAALVVRGDHSVAVLALARDVPAGRPLTAADLRVARLSGSGVSALAAAGSAQVLGQSLAAGLPAGTLLTGGMLNRELVPAPGQQLVALALKAGQVPAEVAPGREVSLVSVTAATAGQAGRPAPTVLVARAKVLSVRTDAAGGLVVLSVQVPAAVAPAAAQAALTGTIAVTLLPVTP